MKWIVASVFVALPFNALSQAEPGRPSPPAECRALVVRSQPIGSNVIGAASSRFSATRIQDLYFGLLLYPKHSPFDVMELRLVTPKGALYQSIAVPIGPAVEGERRLPGYPHPVGVRTSSVVSYGTAALPALTWPPFPVAGTSIVEGSLYGTWRAEARIGTGDPAGVAATAPCVTQTFVLTQ